jgi:hypothetical protein
MKMSKKGCEGEYAELTTGGTSATVARRSHMIPLQTENTLIY